MKKEEIRKFVLQLQDMERGLEDQKIRILLLKKFLLAKLDIYEITILSKGDA